jgi:hypothetical protein
MITFHSQQSDCARRPRKNENAATFNFASQIASSICAVMFTKRVKHDATIFKSRCSRTVVCYRLNRVQALPLVRTRILRLANSSPEIARSPARRSRDGRETFGKKSGEISRVMSAQRPGAGRTVATAMPLNVRQDGSQDNLPCAGLGRAMSAPETCETNSQYVRATAVSQSSRRPMQHLASDSWEFRRQLLTMTPKNYEHTNHTNA